MSEPQMMDGAGVHPRAQTTLYRGGSTGILMLHGLAGSTHDLEDTAAYLHSLGYTVVNARLAGHGTTPEDLAKTTTDQWRQSALHALALLRQHATQFFFFGFSFGGNILIDLLLHEPYQVRGLILIGMPIRTSRETRNKVLLPLALKTGKHFVQKRWVRDRQTIETYRAAGKYIVMPVAAYKRLLDFVIQVTKPALPRVQVPALLLYSHEDYATDPRSAEYAYVHLGSEQKELYWVRLSGTQHHILKSEKQSQVRQKIAEFLANHTQR